MLIISYVSIRYLSFAPHVCTVFCQSTEGISNLKYLGLEVTLYLFLNLCTHRLQWQQVVLYGASLICPRSNATDQFKDLYVDVLHPVHVHNIVTNFWYHAYIPPAGITYSLFTSNFYRYAVFKVLRHWTVWFKRCRNPLQFFIDQHVPRERLPICWSKWRSVWLSKGASRPFFSQQASWNAL